MPSHSRVVCGSSTHHLYGFFLLRWHSLHSVALVFDGFIMSLCLVFLITQHSK